MFWIKSWEIYRRTSRNKIRFSITPFVGDEMRLIEDKDIPRYLFHRYRYEIYPSTTQVRRLSTVPTNRTFHLQLSSGSSVIRQMRVSEKKSDHMGTMSLEMYKQIVDQAAGNIEFLSLASRGESIDL